MKLLPALLFFLAATVSASEDIKDVTYTLSSECVASADINRSSLIPDSWDLHIVLKSQESDKFRTFTGKHIHKLLKLVDVNGSLLAEAIIMEALDANFMITSNDKREAQHAAETLQTTKGKCGPLE